MKRKFGRLYKEDERDKLFTLEPDFAAAAQRDWRYWYPGAPLDQGATPACVGYACWKWLWSGPVRNRSMPWDAYGLYRQAQYWDEWPGEAYDGTSVRGAFKFLKDRGYVSEYRWAYSLMTVVAHLLTVGPLVMGSIWTNGMMEPDSRNYIHPDGGAVGGHAYMLVGVNTAKEKLRVLNSWGSGWGHRGRAWLSFSDASWLISLWDTEVATATEVKA